MKIRLRIGVNLFKKLKIRLNREKLGLPKCRYSQTLHSWVKYALNIRQEDARTFEKP